LKLHYDGWLALPATFRRALGLATGTALEAELVDGAIVLRPVAKTTAKAKAAAAAGPEQAASGDRAGEPTPATRRKPGRPRQAPAAEQPAPALKLEADDEPAPLVEAAAQSELRRKQPPPAPEPHQSWAPVRDPRPERRGPDGQGEREKRPFRQVEVRKLGPGRGHDRASRG
jgi:antitoxin component of MazEF toxin-antitoxin module